jgi:hypothetical protein
MNEICPCCGTLKNDDHRIGYVFFYDPVTGSELESDNIMCESVFMKSSSHLAKRASWYGDSPNCIFYFITGTDANWNRIDLETYVGEDVGHPRYFDETSVYVRTIDKTQMSPMLKHHPL